MEVFICRRDGRCCRGSTALVGRLRASSGVSSGGIAPGARGVSGRRGPAIFRWTRRCLGTCGSFYTGAAVRAVAAHVIAKGFTGTAGARLARWQRIPWRKRVPRRQRTTLASRRPAMPRLPLPRLWFRQRRALTHGATEAIHNRLAVAVYCEVIRASRPAGARIHEAHGSRGDGPTPRLATGGSAKGWRRKRKKIYKPGVLPATA